MELVDFFLRPELVLHKQYEALRAFFVDGMPAEMVADNFGYTTNAVYSLVRDFKQNSANVGPQLFFHSTKPGRKPIDSTGELVDIIIKLRKKYLSVPDIKAVLDVQGNNVSEKYVFNILKKEGFARLPRRNFSARVETLSNAKIEAPKSIALDFEPESFSSRESLGILCLLHYIERYRIHRLIKTSMFPETGATDRLSSILCFLALKLSNIRRYNADDVWCMDRGMGLFAIRNVLPKTAWFTSYSHRVTRRANLSLLKELHKTWCKAGLLSDTANLDFATVPYWGKADHLENNWSGTRHKGMSSILAVLAQDPDSGIITYSDTSVRHRDKSKVVLRFLDFCRANGQRDIDYLVFDSKFTTYENLARLDPDVKFLTIRRRGAKLVDELNGLPASEWKTIRVPACDGKARNLKVNDTRLYLPDYGKEIRQIAIGGHGRIKPALLITNDFDAPNESIVRKYARRWLVEKSISEQLEFFHLNLISSSMVIKVDFDLTMSILAHNLLRVFAMDLPGYEHNADLTIYHKFLRNSGSVEIDDSAITVWLNKKRNLPALLTAMEQFADQRISVFGNRKLIIKGETTS